MLKLALFMTQGMSLASWQRIGTLERETAIYRALKNQRGVETHIVSWGSQKDQSIAQQQGLAAAHPNAFRLPRSLYERLLPLLHRRSFREIDLFKTNQMMGADLALRTARHFGKPLIARCGYMWSKNVIIEDGIGSPRAHKALQTESFVFQNADHIIVTTREMADDVIERFATAEKRISIIPNYVETDRFRPPADRLCCATPILGFVGRIAAEKNLANLLDAIKGLNVEMKLAGDGPLRESLQAKAEEQGNAHFVGRVPNIRLPEFLRNCSAFVFPSLYEGHPKSLIEAMACGLPVVATNIAGIRELITHGKTGILCEPDVQSIRDSICYVLSNPEYANQLGRNAHRFVEEHFSIEKIVEKEWQVYQRVYEGRKVDLC